MATHEPRMRGTITKCAYDKDAHTLTIECALADKPFNKGKDAKRNMWIMGFGNVDVNGDYSSITLRVDSSEPV